MSERVGSTPLNNAMSAARPAILTAAIFSFFINVLALVSPIYMLQIYDRVLTSRNIVTLILITLVAFYLLLVYALLELCRTQVLVRGGVRFEKVIRSPLFESVLSSALVKNSTSEAQAFRDVDTIREFLTGYGLLAFCDAPWIPVFVAACFMLHPVFGFLTVGGGVLIFGLAVANEVATRNSLGEATKAMISAQGDVAATLRNSEVMRAMGMWRGLQTRWSKRRDEQLGWQGIASRRGGSVLSAVKFLRQVLQIMILGSGAYLAIMGEASAGAMIAASILAGRALAPIEASVGQWKPFVLARGAWARVQNLLRATRETNEKMALPAPTGHLSVENVYVGPPNTDKMIIRGVSFLLEPGSVLGVVGPSAAGKSSLVRALVGVWHASTGTVRIDGFDIRQWDVLALGQHIGYLPQDVELFAGTIAQNIARFTDANPTEIIESATLAGVHEMIQQLPNGYDTSIGEGGAALSGGQRQRIALARALFGNPALIVLDEPNANLDAPGEAALVDAIAKLRASGRAIIFVTHKPNLLSVTDKILVLNQGMVQGFGSRDEILPRLLGARVGPPAAVQVVR